MISLSCLMFFLPCVNCAESSLYIENIECALMILSKQLGMVMAMIYLPCSSFLSREQVTSLVSKFGLNLIINQSVTCYLSVHHLRAVTSLESRSYSSQEITNPWGQLSPVNYVSTKFSNRTRICELANLSVTLHSVS